MDKVLFMSFLLFVGFSTVFIFPAISIYLNLPTLPRLHCFRPGVVSENMNVTNKYRHAHFARQVYNFFRFLFSGFMVPHEV